MLSQQDNRLIYAYDAEKVWIEPWGPNALRVRATKLSSMPPEDWALLPPTATPDAQINISPASATLTNGKITATITARGKLTVSNTSTGTVLLEEYARHRLDVRDPKCSALNIAAREFRPVPHGGDAHHLTARFESLDARERLFGMGQYQQPLFDLKGADLELAHRNSQASVPFVLSSRGYGLLWNNPAVGRAALGTNVMSFEAYSTKGMDYWVVAGDAPAEIVRAYAGATGTVPRMPAYGLGFWQCKLRYQTQEELLGVAREYRRRGLPLDLIVVDFFHWPMQGEWKFDTTYWPDPDAMVKELKEMKVELMVSVWPTVDKRSENWDEMVERGLLVRVDKGLRTTMDFQGETVYFDATNPEARKYVWDKAKTNYYDKGIRTFWLDEAEPEYSVYDFENYRYYSGSNLSIGNIYPLEYSRAFYEGLKSEGHEDVVNLVRCAWAGSQKYGALVWSGDIASSWSSFRNQLAAGLHMGIAGLPWWTTDIGGFHGGDPNDEAFRELFVRWFQWGAYCPVFRLHGDREPQQPQHGTTGGATCLSGAPNEVWSYGPEVYEICKQYMEIREAHREYIQELMEQAHQDGTPVMRPLFFEFPDDPRCWETGEEYMFGYRFLVCPVMKPGARKLKVYFPEGAEWTAYQGEGVFKGGQTVEVDCPLEHMPVFVRADSSDELPRCRWFRVRSSTERALTPRRPFTTSVHTKPKPLPSSPPLHPTRPHTNLVNKVAIVTGAGSQGSENDVGNGSATAILLAEAGAAVLCVDKHLSLAEHTVYLINQATTTTTTPTITGGQAVAVEADVTNPDDCRRIAEHALSLFGKLDILVNVVGITGAAGAAPDVDIDAWDAGMRVNVTSMMLMAKYAVPAMLRNDRASAAAAGRAVGGAIVNVGSVAGLRGGTPHLLYPTSKGAVVNMTRAMAAQHGRDGVRVNCVCPGMLYTPMMYREGMSEEMREKRKQRSLLGTEGNVWDCAHAIRFLAGDEARWITGAILPVDAGATAATSLTS